ncbi:MAG: hypothetical protein E7E13_05660 [Actinomyces sp.]|uniref:hypothetical protein n=1 Tax=Actinomyces sp. TaxID=29317 RepID=UPI0028FEE1CC|nr:hypothetical protein [Actinomyces sp.]MDU2259690.1 hypothetical protein [Actinomyces sp.]
MSELRITPVQVPVSQAKGVDPAFLAAAQQGSVQRGLPQPAAVYSAPATGGALVTAYLIDLACLVTITALSWWFYPSIAIAVIVALETWIVGTLIRAHSGRTPGAFAMQVAAISMAPVTTDAGPEAGHAPGLARQSAHSLIMLLLHATVVGPAVTWAIARDGQTWVDRVCGMGNLDVRAGRTDAGAPAYSQQLSPSFAEASAGVGAAPAQLQGMDPAALAPAHQWAGPRVTSPEVPASDPAALSVPPTGVPAADLPAPSPMPEAPSQVLSEMPAPVPTQHAAQTPAAPKVPTPPRHSSASAMPRVPQVPMPQATPATSAPASVPAFAQAAPLAIIVDDGQRIEVNAPIVLGRAPEQTHSDARAVAIADSTRSLSRTHLRVAPADGDAMWVEDTFSANGTRLQAPDGTTQPLPRGERVKVSLGTVLLLGERKLSVSR